MIDDSDGSQHSAQSDDSKDDSFASFVDYRRAVLDLTNDLRTLQKHATNLGLPAAAGEIDVVLKRMQSEKFNVVVVGEFNRGKSTLVNALLGVHVAPTDVLACTAVLTRVTYSIDKRAVIKFNDGHEEQVAYDALPDYVTKLTTESAAKAASISGATIYYPSPYCQNNVDVIDTPGLNEDATMTAVTLSVLPEADAAIMVIMANAPFGEYEREFLESRLLTADLGRVIFVVTGIDNIETPEDAERVLAGIRKRISDNVMTRAKRQWGEGSEEFERYLRKIGSPRVYGMSARNAFRAKQKMDIEALNRSRFPAFEARLQNLLTEQRGAVMLQPPLNRALTASRVLTEALNMREAALNLSEADFDRAMEEANEKLKEANERWQIERSTMEKTALRVRQMASDLGLGFVAAMKESVSAEILAMNVKATQLSGAERKKLDKEVESAVNLAMSRTIDEYSIKLTNVIEQILSNEASRLKELDSRLSSLMGDIGHLFSDFETEESNSGIGEKVAMGIAVGLGWTGGVWGGYKIAGLKGAAVGLGASVGTLGVGIAAVVATGIAVPILPFLAAVGIVSYFTGGWAAGALFEESRIETYKERAVRAALKNLDKAFAPQSVADRFGEKALISFEAFKEGVRFNAEAVLSDAREQLHRTRIEYGQNQTATKQDRATGQAIRAEIEGVLRRAADLSNKLAKKQVADDMETQSAS